MGETECCKWPYIWTCTDYQIVFGVLFSALGVSIALNIYCCASKHCSGKKKSKDRTRSYENSRSQRQMEDNPIYGNIALQSTQADTESSFTSPVRRDQCRINAVSEDCYANLGLQMAMLDGGPCAPLGPGGPDSEKDPEDTEVLSDISELYASVQTRAKILHSPDSAEEYANHL